MSRIRMVEYRWHLRQVMASRGLFSTTDLAPLLAERGIELSPAQVYRLVTGTPERLNLHVLAALCDALECSTADLVEPVVVAEAEQRRRASASGTGPGAGRGRSTGASGSDEEGARARRPTRARIVPDK